MIGMCAGPNFSHGVFLIVDLGAENIELELWFPPTRHQFPHIKFLKATKIKPFSSFATALNILLIEDEAIWSFTITTIFKQPTFHRRPFSEVSCLQLFSNNSLAVGLLSEQGWVIKIFANKYIPQKICWKQHWLRRVNTINSIRDACSTVDICIHFHPLSSTSGLPWSVSERFWLGMDIWTITMVKNNS